jgi:ABC-type antimicrobial peptide transport system permease subunit
MVLLAGIKLLALGIVLGLAGGLAASRLLREQIWSVSPFDPLSFTLVSVILLVAGVQACLLPAWRAARVDPVVALRSE